MAEIDVILPVYNRAALLPRAVASALEQKEKGADFLLWVVDDGSEDDVAEAMRPFVHDSRVRLLRCEHGGVSRARNIGVAAGSAPWVAFLDSDDQWLPGKLQAQMELMRVERQPINQTEDIWFRHGVRVNPPAHYRKQSGDLFLPSLDYCQITPSSVLLTRELFSRSGGFDESFPACEDYDLWLRITDRVPVGLVRKPLMIRHGGHSDQLSTSVPTQDRLRARALSKWLDANPRDPRHNPVRAALTRKLSVLNSGYAKRQNPEGMEFCRALSQRHLENPIGNPSL